MRSRLMILASTAACVFGAAAPLNADPFQAKPTHQAGAYVKPRQFSAGPQKHRRSILHLARPTPLNRVAIANREAVRQPQSAYFLGAVQVYPWREGALYQLYSAPEQISDIELQSGENLLSVAAGDTARWIIGDTVSGSGPSRRSHILLKPVAPGLITILVIATDRRIYHLEAVSTARTAMAAISWTYPEESMAIARSSAALQSAPVAASGVAPENLNFGYRIEGDNAAWRPVRVFDDGHQTFIEFPPTIGDGEAPPLFIIDAAGKTELVNYRVKGRYYVVDGLFAAAELRLGDKHQQVVRIVRVSGAPGERRAA
ncbi:MAG TPA: P-type conjugative transfer protein TrbG [Sphingomicrobium sp.]|nr:P-type conjugative transfer protein TrbG [Sphingomicrobium sp.]